MQQHHLKPLSQVMKDWKEQGYTTDFIFKQGRLQSMGGEKTYPPQEVTVVAEYRFEGESNPADSSILRVIHCQDDTKGLISNAYGAEADVETEEFFQQIPSPQPK